MLTQMLITEMQSRTAFVQCMQAYAEEIVPLLAKSPGFQHVDFAGEEGNSFLTIVTITWTSRDAAMNWSNSASHRRLLATLSNYSVGGVVTKFFRIEDERGNLRRHILN